MVRVLPASFALVVLVALACRQEPRLDVRTADGPESTPPSAGASTPAAPASLPALAPSAPPLAEGAPLPADHPPLEIPADHPPLGSGSLGAPALVPVAPDAGTGSAALAWQTPAGWVAETPSSSMRRAQYRVPGPGGEGECVVFYFGPGQGGEPMANAQRWAAQFEPEGGKSPQEAMTTRALDSKDVPVLVVETAGTYHSGSMIGAGQGVDKPGWALLGAIAQGPDANWFFKFTGPKATVEAHRAAFEAMVKSLERKP